MATVTKKELVYRIAESTGLKKVVVKGVIQRFISEIINELGNANRLEFREFGVFEVKIRAARTARNPRTSEPVLVPAKTVVHFKAGRMMKDLAERMEKRTLGAAIPSPPNPQAKSPPGEQKNAQAGAGG